MWRSTAVDVRTLFKSPKDREYKTRTGNFVHLIETVLYQLAIDMLQRVEHKEDKAVAGKQEAIGECSMW
jgi:hypothetical protein